MSTQYTLYSHRGPGPNPLKAAALMEFLGVTYDVVPLDFGDDPEKGVKGAKFLKINPNGRVPCLVSNDSDGFAVWESGAILYYLCDKHDKEGRFLGKTPEERAIVMQWLTHQLSGLGPTQVRIYTHFMHTACHVWWCCRGEEHGLRLLRRESCDQSPPCDRVRVVFDICPLTRPRFLFVLSLPTG